MTRWVIGGLLALAVFGVLVIGGVLLWSYGYDAGVRAQRRAQCLTGAVVTRDAPELRGTARGKMATLWLQPAFGGRCTGLEGAA